MLSVDKVVNDKLPLIKGKPWLEKPTTWVLRNLLHEEDIQKFGKSFPSLEGIDFVEHTLDYFNFTYSYSSQELDNIPVSGRLVIIANHPIGSLDGLALLKLVSEMRSDVKIVANEWLSALEPLNSLLLPVNVFGGKPSRKDIRNIHNHLHDEGCVILFPAGEVSRLRPNGVRDTHWQSGFLKIAKATQSDILPIRLDAHNSAWFYTASMVYKPLATMLLVKEMFRQQRKQVKCHIGQRIPVEAFLHQGLSVNQQVKLFKKHLYRLGTQKKPIFPTQTAIARPESRQPLKAAIEACELLGETPCGKKIYLYEFSGSSPILREIGRLREVAFRTVGEGTWRKRDLDEYDTWYMHLILWDPDDLEIAGAYRLGDCKKIIETHGQNGLYSDGFYEFSDAMKEIFPQSLELGRSFVQPRYWGKRSLDYLWVGIGALLRKHPNYRYLFGSVSISNALPKDAQAALVKFYSSHFPPQTPMARANIPYRLNTDSTVPDFTGNNYADEFVLLKSYMANIGSAIPTLYKQYSELCEPGGVQFLEFGVDPDFNHSIDGLVLVDTTKLSAKKRKRYLETR